MSESRRDRPGRPTGRASRKPEKVWRHVARSVRAATPLVVIGPPIVLIAYLAAYAATGARATADFYASAAQVIPVLLLVLAVEGRVFRWEIAAQGVVPADLGRRIADYASGEAEVGEAVDAVLRAATSAANVLIRQLTALLLLAALLVGEVVALVPLLTGSTASVSAEPVMSAIVAGLAGVAYIAITGASFLELSDERESSREPAD